MVSEERARELIKQFVYKCYDSLGYGKKVNSICNDYIVNGKYMTVSEYQEYCIKREFKKFGL